MNSSLDLLPRRKFLATSAATIAGASLVGFPNVLRSAPAGGTLKVALVGCGGRGTGAAKQALSADSNIELVAMADIAEDQIAKSLDQLQKNVPGKVKEGVKKFLGLDAIDKVLNENVDVVLLTTPPGFRPAHFEKCVQAGKHTFCEKPCATDAPGVRRFMEAGRIAKEKGLGMQSGFCWRSNYAERATFEQIHAGAVGDIRAVHGTYLAGTPWVKPRQPGWTDLEWQLRNWMYFTWLGGDQLVEQCVHTIDKMSWTFRDVLPLNAQGMGGRQQRIEEQYGHVWDHDSVVYEYPGDARAFIQCRQQAGTFNETADYIMGSKGVCRINGFGKQHRISGETTWKYEGPANDMYQTEHDEFFKSLRDGQPLNFADKIAQSTMIAIMGRMACYTGKVITWEEALASTESLAPEKLDWNGTYEVPPVAVPGRTKFS